MSRPDPPSTEARRGPGPTRSPQVGISGVNVGEPASPEKDSETARTRGLITQVGRFRIEDSIDVPRGETHKRGRLVAFHEASIAIF